MKTDAVQLLDNAQSTEQSNTQMANSIIGISKNVEQQQSMVEQSANAVNDVTQGIVHITDNTLAVADTTQISMEKAQTGQQSVEKVVNQMATINKSNKETAKMISDLVASSTEIGKITDAITAISQQTNLLALNAAIEAARAGEHGKGFAVVADEVKKLAEEFHRSANMITQIVQTIQNYTKSIEQLMKHTDNEIQSGIQAVTETGVTFDDIYGTIESSNIQIQELSAISEQMSASMQEINASFEEVANLAKQTSVDANSISSDTEQQFKLTVQVKDSAEKLSGKANELQKAIEGFEV
ncbi:MAG: hypothetical protein KBT36_00105 [Kurthia sp.]|nr:hypothetical protein [Candidatus Kurthia equi]